MLVHLTVGTPITTKTVDLWDSGHQYNEPDTLGSTKHIPVVTTGVVTTEV